MNAKAKTVRVNRRITKPTKPPIVRDFRKYGVPLCFREATIELFSSSDQFTSLEPHLYEQGKLLLSWGKWPMSAYGRVAMGLVRETRENP